MGAFEAGVVGAFEAGVVDAFEAGVVGNCTLAVLNAALRAVIFPLFCATDVDVALLLFDWVMVVVAQTAVLVKDDDDVSPNEEFVFLDHLYLSLEYFSPAAELLVEE